MIRHRPDFVHGSHWRELSPEEGQRRYRFEARDMQIEIARSSALPKLDKVISFRDGKGREWARLSGPIFSLSPTYQWNGNSPKAWVPFFGWIGTPDCRGDVTGLGGNIQASGFHDAMRQFMHTEHFPLSLLEVDQCFYDINCLSGFCGALPFFSAVQAGYRSGIWKHKPNGEHSVIVDS
jgi:hypothetical protein